MADKAEVWQGTLALMVLKTLETMGPLHGYGIARRIEQTSGDALSLNYGTLYPALLKLEQEGAIASEWGVSSNNRRAKYYRLTRAGTFPFVASFDHVGPMARTATDLALAYDVMQGSDPADPVCAKRRASAICRAGPTT